MEGWEGDFPPWFWGEARGRGGDARGSASCPPTGRGKSSRAGGSAAVSPSLGVCLFVGQMLGPRDAAGLEPAAVGSPLRGIPREPTRFFQLCFQAVLERPGGASCSVEPNPEPLAQLLWWEFGRQKGPVGSAQLWASLGSRPSSPMAEDRSPASAPLFPHR